MAFVTQFSPGSLLWRPFPVSSPSDWPLTFSILEKDEGSMVMKVWENSINELNRGVLGWFSQYNMRFLILILILILVSSNPMLGVEIT